MITDGQGAIATAPAVAPRSRSLRVAAGLIVAAGLVFVVPTGSHAAVYVCSAALLALWAGPAWFALHHGRLDAFETIHFLGAYYFVCYGLGSIWSVEDPSRVAYDLSAALFVPQAAFYCLIGYAALVVGYYAPWFREKPRVQTRLVFNGVWAVMLPGALGLLGSLSSALLVRGMWLENRISNVASSFAQLQPFFLYAWACAWLIWFSGRATAAQRRMLFGFLAPSAIAVGYLLLTSKSSTLILATVPLVAYWYVRQRLPWLTLTALSLVLIFVIFPFYNTFREFDPRIGQSTRVEMTAEALGRLEGGAYVEHSIVGFKARMALVNSVAVAVRDVGRWVPFAHGETIFFPAVAYFVPRALWPEKPQFTLGREFGRLFRVVGPTDDQTSIAPTIPGELYWNFSWPGILFGMAIWGTLMRWLYRRYGSVTAADPARLAIHLVILTQFVFFDGGIAGHGVGLARVLLLFEVYLWIARRVGLLSTAPASAPAVAL